MGRPLMPRVTIHGPTLGALMLKHEMSPAGLAMRAGVSAPFIRMLRAGQRKTTKAVTAQRIADALGEPVRAFATPLPLGGAQTEESA